MIRVFKTLFLVLLFNNAIALGQTTDDLIDNGLQNRGRDIFLGQTLIEKGLDIGLGKYPAP